MSAYIEGNVELYHEWQWRELSLLWAWEKKKILHTDLWQMEKKCLHFNIVIMRLKPGDILMCARMVTSSFGAPRVLGDHSLKTNVMQESPERLPSARLLVSFRIHLAHSHHNNKGHTQPFTGWIKPPLFTLLQVFVPASVDVHFYQYNLVHPLLKEDFGDVI